MADVTSGDPTAGTPSDYAENLLAELRGATEEVSRLVTTKDALADLLLAHIEREFSIDGDPVRLRELALLFKDAYGVGHQKRWAQCNLPHFNSLMFARKVYRTEENDGPGRWKGDWPVEDGGVVPPQKTPVVYQLLSRGDVVYIGSSINLVSRLAQHVRDKEFDAWRAARCESEQACRDLETALIDAYRPPLNRMIPKPRVALSNEGA